MKRHWQLKSILMYVKDLFIIHDQYHGCWWPGDARSQGISSGGINLFTSEYSDLSIKRVNTAKKVLSKCWLFVSAISDLSSHFCVDWVHQSNSNPTALFSSTKMITQQMNISFCNFCSVDDGCYTYCSLLNSDILCWVEWECLIHPMCITVTHWIPFCYHSLPIKYLDQIYKKEHLHHISLKFKFNIV